MSESVSYLSEVTGDRTVNQMRIIMKINAISDFVASNCYDLITTMLHNGTAFRGNSRVGAVTKTQIKETRVQ